MPIPMTIDPTQLRLQSSAVGKPKRQTAADFRTALSAAQPGTVTGLGLSGLPKEAAITNAAISGTTGALAGAGIPYAGGLGAEVAPGTGVTQFELIERMRMTNLELIGLQAQVQNMSREIETVANINKAKHDAAINTIRTVGRG